MTDVRHGVAERFKSIPVVFVEIFALPHKGAERAHGIAGGSAYPLRKEHGRKRARHVFVTSLFSGNIIIRRNEDCLNLGPFNIRGIYLRRIESFQFFQGLGSVNRFSETAPSCDKSLKDSVGVRRPFGRNAALALVIGPSDISPRQVFPLKGKHSPILQCFLPLTPSSAFDSLSLV
ncbi:hypothetical protein SDC9_154033 [bioreactor metagenome]|uniref:Uncharacterized protein n=1 Tax=bioreactor metagenome TaxID=1076179 RepID=A0A645EZC0_9ZZZZ